MWIRSTWMWGLLLAGSNVCVAEDSPGSLASRSRWIDFDVALGRLAAFNVRCPKTASASEASDDSLLRETFAVSPEGPKVRYERITPGRQLLIEIDGDAVAIDSRPLPPEENAGESEPPLDADLPAWRFRQTRRDVRIEIDSPAAAKGAVQKTAARATAPPAIAATAPTLWHLLLAEPELCRQHLLPALEMLRPNWGLAERAEASRERLLSLAPTAQPHPTAEWRSLLQQLDSDSYQTRVAAYEKLQAAGTPAALYFDRFDRRALSAEQRMRIDLLVRSICPANGDRPEQIAWWILDDLDFWKGAIAGADSDLTEAAALRLAILDPARFGAPSLAGETKRVAESLERESTGRRENVLRATDRRGGGIPLAPSIRGGRGGRVRSP